MEFFVVLILFRQKKSTNFQIAINELVEFANKIESFNLMNTITPFNLDPFAKEFNDSYSINRYMEMILELWKIQDNTFYKCLNCPEFLNHVFQICL